jgi:hypothetical protein
MGLASSLARTAARGSLCSTLAAAILATVALSEATSPAAAVERERVPTATHGAAIPEKWVGTWRLVSETLVDQNGTAVGSLFTDTVGKLTYTPRGDVWALVGPRVPSESASAIWYTGTAEVRRKAGVVVHHVQYSSLASWIDTDLLRSYEFFANGKGLTLSADVTPELTDVLKWRKAGARWAGPL